MSQPRNVEWKNPTRPKVYRSMNAEMARLFSEEGPGCPQPLCPLNRVKAGVAVRIKQLCANPELSNRLREIGFCEDRIVKLLTSHNNIICLVCNTRLALNEQLAKTILVEPVHAHASQ